MVAYIMKRGVEFCNKIKSLLALDFQTIITRKRDYVELRKNCIAQRGARTHDPEIKSLMLYRLS